METKAVIERLLIQAVSAPSGDNSQPWWFHWNGDLLEINVVPDRDNPILNYRLSGSHVAIGALIENIIILCSVEQLAVKLEIFPEKGNSTLAARLRFQKSQDQAVDSLADFVTKRFTNRKPYKKQAISVDILKEISLCSKLINENSGLQVITDKPSILEAATASSVMEQVALETESIHHLFFSSILWSEEEAKNGTMGLPIKTTELPIPVQLLFRLIKRWSVAKILNRVGLSKLAAKADAQTYASSAAMGVIMISENSPEAYLNAGRVFERAWVTSAKYGLGFQPVTGVLFLAQRVLSGEIDQIHKKHISLIQNAYETIHRLFSSKNQMPALLFRIGYADSPTAYTYRRPPEFRN